MIMSLITANTAGSTKRSTVNALFFISYCVGNIIGPFSFKPSEAPVYESGIIAIMVAYCVEIGLLVSFAFYMAWMNRRKAASLATLQSEIGADEQQRALAAFSDHTDRENPYFRFSY